MKWRKFVVCPLFGYLGVHKFMEKKIGMGFLYLFTMGLLGIGWSVDAIRYLVIAVKGVKDKNNAMRVGAVTIVLLFQMAMNSSQETSDTKGEISWYKGRGD